MHTGRVSRRSTLTRIGTIFLGFGAALGVGYAGSRPAAALEADDEFLAEDVRIERNDGTVSAVSVAPELRFRWRNFGGGVETVDVMLSAAIEDVGGFDVLLDASIESEAITVEGDRLDETDGTATLAVDRRDLTDVGSAVTIDDFGGDIDPEREFDRCRSRLTGVDIAGMQGEKVIAFETASFDVTVHNPEGTATGRANTDVE